MSMIGNRGRRAFLKAAGASLLSGAFAQSAQAQSYDLWMPQGLRRFSTLPPTLEAVKTIPEMCPSISGSIHCNLVLCMDSSTSMRTSQDNFTLQAEGTAAALESDEVCKVIVQCQGIAVTCVQFASSARQTVPWAFISGQEDARKYASLIRAAGMRLNGATHITSGLYVAEHVLKGAPFKTYNAAVDVSGDGVNDNGYFILKDATKSLAHSIGARVNGIAICDKVPALDAYFRDQLVTDEATFNETGIPRGKTWTVSHMGDFKAVMRQKLIEEIAAVPSRMRAYEIRPA